MEPVRQIKTYLRERYGTHGVVTFWYELADDNISNWMLSKHWRLSICDIQCLRRDFAAFTLLVFPRKKKSAVVLKFKTRETAASAGAVSTTPARLL